MALMAVQQRDTYVLHISLLSSLHNCSLCLCVCAAIMGLCRTQAAPWLHLRTLQPLDIIKLWTKGVIRSSLHWLLVPTAAWLSCTLSRAERSPASDRPRTPEGRTAMRVLCFIRLGTGNLLRRSLC